MHLQYFSVLATLAAHLEKKFTIRNRAVDWIARVSVSKKLIISEKSFRVTLFLY